MWFSLQPLPLAAAPEAFAGGFGAAAAIVLVGGSILLRWQRSRHQFVLMQAALERGITQFPGSPPFWLLSLRQGLTILTLGLGLMLTGAGSWWLGHGVAQPSADALTTAMQAPPPGPPEKGEEGPPPGFQGAGPGMGLMRGGPQGGPLGGPPRQPPPPRNPAVQLWERAQLEQTLGKIAVGCGLILTLLGAVRIAFSRVERRYNVTAPDSGTPSI